jgi:hypothetical protein
VKFPQENPGWEQITSDATDGFEASGMSKNTMGSLVPAKTSLAPSSIPPTAVCVSPVGVEDANSVNPIGESDVNPGDVFRVNPVEAQTAADSRSRKTDEAIEDIDPGHRPSHVGARTHARGGK